MTDETSNTAVSTEATPAKKPYVKPQLHVLMGDGAEGKFFQTPGEYASTGPS